MSREKFLVDTNTFITPYKTYYPFDIAPSFWDFLKEHIENDSVAVLRVVYNELLKGSDELSSWLRKLKFAKLDHLAEDIAEEWKNVQDHIKNGCSVTGSKLYNDRASFEWADAGRADAFLVAAAKARGFTLITFEAPNRSLGTSTCAHPKIPDVADYFHVKYGSLFDMMRALGFAFR
jgi:hypothetical protein